MFWILLRFWGFLRIYACVEVGVFFVEGLWCVIVFWDFDLRLWLFSVGFEFGVGVLGLVRTGLVGLFWLLDYLLLYCFGISGVFVVLVFRLDLILFLCGYFSYCFGLAFGFFCGCFEWLRVYLVVFVGLHLLVVWCSLGGVFFLVRLFGLLLWVWVAFVSG